MLYDQLEESSHPLCEGSPRFRLVGQMSSGNDGDRHHEHLGVSQTKQAKKKKSRRPIDPEDIAGSISSALEHISHDTHLFAVSFGTADPRQYYPNYRQPVGASSTSQALPSRRYEDLPLQAIRRARPLSVGTPSPTGTSPQLSAMRLGDSSSGGRMLWRCASIDLVFCASMYHPRLLHLVLDI
ncbi:hypothetical protein H5410_052337 [Solanum commersonii]|uniref:Uncharacterized protein n=1 Tax=Solanum commersonii TaxID=4109 RepID=A0A9J5X3B3_SOLCO|nr:hypothetical protein H5410_052337 [Solanum commersonii]